ncbi:hypothetical protein AB0J80_10225 [Actinoplanes sp. NPDC049548]|uniref:hypothetical protein n=1 Tax=Actinoplanes sp. NPDC049548 TaxID=3155152 RepID=UPI00343254E1
MAECAVGDVVWIGDLGKVADFFDDGIDGILNDIANAIMGAAIDLFSDMADVGTLSSEGTNNSIKDQINWLAVSIAVASLLFAAIRMALERRGQPGTTALKGLVRMLVVGAASWVVLGWLAKQADSYTQHLYDAGVKQQLAIISQCGTDGLTAFLLIIVGILLLLAGIIHIMLMYIRLGVMTLLTGTLPLAAAASMTEWGSSWWRKHIAWMVAWLVFKPATGLILYAGAVMINASGGDAKEQKIAGCGVLLLAAVALPALLRLVVPAAAALGSGDGMSATAGAAGAAAGAAATGAKVVSGGGRGLAAGGKGLQAAGARVSGAAAAAGAGAAAAGRASGGGNGSSGGGSTSGGGGGSASGGSASGGGGEVSGTRRAVGGILAGAGAAAAWGGQAVRAGGAAAGGAARATGAVTGAAAGLHRHASGIGNSALPGEHDGEGR